MRHLYRKINTYEIEELSQSAETLGQLRLAARLTPATAGEVLSEIDVMAI